MNAQLKKDIIEDYRSVVMSNNADHIFISDDEILRLWNGIDMCQEMTNIEGILRTTLEKGGQFFLAKHTKDETLQSWVRESVWEKYGLMDVDMGIRFVFKKRVAKNVTFTHVLSEETILNTFLCRVLNEKKYTEIGCNDEGVDYIILEDEMLKSVMADVSESGEINIRIIPDAYNTKQDYVVRAIDTFGLYQFCEKVISNQ